MSGSAVHKNCYPILYIYWVVSPLLFFIMITCPDHILESTEEIEMKLGL